MSANTVMAFNLFGTKAIIAYVVVIVVVVALAMYTRRGNVTR